MNKCTQWFGGLSGLNFPCWQELALNESVLRIYSFFPHQKKKDKKSVWISNHFDLCVYFINCCLNLCELLWSETQLQSPRLWAQIILNQIFYNVTDVLNNTQQLIIITTFFCIILPCCNQFKYSSSHKPRSSPPQNAFQNTAANEQLINKEGCIAGYGFDKFWMETGTKTEDHCREQQGKGEETSSLQKPKLKKNQNHLGKGGTVWFWRGAGGQHNLLFAALFSSGRSVLKLMGYGATQPDILKVISFVCNSSCSPGSGIMCLSSRASCDISTLIQIFLWVMYALMSNTHTCQQLNVNFFSQRQPPTEFVLAWVYKHIFQTYFIFKKVALMEKNAFKKLYKVPL